MGQAWTAVYAMNVDGTNVRRLSQPGAADYSPAWSPRGNLIAFASGSGQVGRSDVYVMKTDGSDRKTIFKGKSRSLFGMSWSEPPEQVVFSHGVVFGKSGARVNIIAASPDSDEFDALTSESGNNGFPFYSPDGKQIVFRSGRNGSKNLYIMDRSGANVRRLTQGKWIDTMCHWSSTGEWITFSSDRGDDFEIWLIRPDGTGLRKLIGGGGRNNHPHFSPDGKWIVFTSQSAGYSAEEVSLPSQAGGAGDFRVVSSEVVPAGDESGRLRMYYAGYRASNRAYILSALSQDGLEWEKEADPVISPGAGRSDAAKCSEMCIIRLPDREGPIPRYRIFYEACDGTAKDERGVWRIAGATSKV